MKKSVFKLFDKLINESKSQKTQLKDIATELEKFDINLINQIIDKKYTMTSVHRLINTLKSCYYVVENNIPGDFVECGVWRGGNAILVKKRYLAP